MRNGLALGVRTMKRHPRSPAGRRRAARHRRPQTRQYNRYRIMQTGLHIPRKRANLMLQSTTDYLHPSGSGVRKTERNECFSHKSQCILGGLGKFFFFEEKSVSPFLFEKLIINTNIIHKITKKYAGDSKLNGESFCGIYF
jgi:hypothetical protein